MRPICNMWGGVWLCSTQWADLDGNLTYKQPDISTRILTVNFQLHTNKKHRALLHSKVSGDKLRYTLSIVSGFAIKKVLRGWRDVSIASSTWMFLQSTWVQFPTWWFKQESVTPVSGASVALFWPPVTPHTKVVHTHTCRITLTQIKFVLKKILNGFAIKKRYMWEITQGIIHIKWSDALKHLGFPLLIWLCFINNKF